MKGSKWSWIRDECIKTGYFESAKLGFSALSMAGVGIKRNENKE